jgi:hypothetical protein
VHIGDYELLQQLGYWMLPLRVSIPDLPSNAFVPDTSDWVVLLDPDYPAGEVRIHPAKLSNFVATFQHQRANLPPTELSQFRLGNICVDEGTRSLGRFVSQSEPQDASRLQWCVLRAVGWLTNAATGTLVNNGEPFEMPEYPSLTTSGRLVFVEEPAKLAKWLSLSERLGFVRLTPLRSNETISLATEFLDHQMRSIATSPLPDHLAGGHGKMILGAWMLFDQPVILPPWQAPFTIEELKQAAELQGIDFVENLRLISHKFRDGGAHALLVGFPIPERIGEAPKLLHWQAQRFPVLSSGKRFAKGFRPNENGYWRNDLQTILARDSTIEWIKSENWSTEYLLSRGALPSELRKRKVVLLGAGALGSVLADILTRSGLSDLTVVDADRLEAGNLVRHIGTLQGVGEYKATVVSSILRSHSPFSKARGIPLRFPLLPEADLTEIAGADVIIDCTASNDVLRALESIAWTSKKLFLSYSIGLNATRLFAYSAIGDTFPAQAYQQSMEPWLELENAGEAEGGGLAREGTGCWSPVFPATTADIWLMAALIAKHVSAAMNADSTADGALDVYEQAGSGDTFVLKHIG